MGREELLQVQFGLPRLPQEIGRVPAEDGEESLENVLIAGLGGPSRSKHLVLCSIGRNALVLEPERSKEMSIQEPTSIVDIEEGLATDEPHSQAPITWVGVDARLQASEFGWKAANLCLSRVLCTRTPQGFAISKYLVRRIAKHEASPAELDNLRDYWERLIRKAPEGPAIVRSSSCIEGAGSNSFAGLFKTTRGIGAFEKLIAAIRRCYSSGHSRRVMAYASFRGLSIPDEHMGVLVQHQVRPISYSALIQVSKSGYLFEAYEGELSSRIQGRGLPEYVVRFYDGHTEILRANERLSDNFFEDLRQIAQEVQKLTADSDSPADAVLETATDGKSLYVFQLNLVGMQHTLNPRRPSLNFDVSATALKVDEPHLGVKGAAMQYFHRAGLFDLPICIVPPAGDLNKVAQEIYKLPRANGYTARFSCGTDIGLPRCFKPDLESVVKWVLSSRQSNWATIVHPHINVRSSFEILLTEDSILLEHVPGMWESDNSLDPDVLIIDGAHARAWRCTQDRPARFAYPEGWQEETIKAIPTANIKQWAERLSSVIGILRHDFEAALPLNFHFVEDSNSRWYFLNVRRGFALDMPAVAQLPPHVVREAGDLDKWDQRSPILLQFTSPRGAEARVLSIAERLPRRHGFPILIDFGLLSHPAMILRELGFALVPTYLHLGKRLLSPSYQKYQWKVDLGDDPLARIRKEPTLYRDHHIRVVPDRDPIVPDHFLVVGEASDKSFADSAAHASLGALFSGKAHPLFSPGQWIFAERGRARFCTSGFTSVHAHGHLLPATRFDRQAIVDLAKHLGSTSYDCLEEAFREARRSAREYVLIVSPSGTAYLSLLSENQLMDKRLIRSFFKERVQ